MAQSVPLEPRWPDDVSPAELVMWRWAVDLLPDSVMVLPQVAMNVRERGAYQAAEADLVLIDLSGIITVVEVKGGRISYDAGAGVWRNLDALGARAMDDPISQLHRTRRILRSLLTQERFDVDRFEWRWALAVPDVRLEAPGGGIIDGPQLWDSLAAERLGGLYASLVGEPRAGLRPIEDVEVERLVAALRGRSRVGRETLPSTLTAHDEEFSALTESHRNVHYQFARHPRVLVRGGAGTGKTVLALRLAATHAALGQRVLLTCWNIALAASLRQALAAELAALGAAIDVTADPTGQVVVTDIADLAQRASGAEAPAGTDLGVWYHEMLPNLLTPSVTAGEFDVVVLDEAQDLSEGWVIALAGLVARQGRWFAFTDDQQDLFRVDAALPDFLEVRHELRENFRNTAAIARFAADFGDVELDALAGEGPPVRFVAARQDRVIDRTKEVGKRLQRDEGVRAQDLATLWLFHNPSHLKTEEVIEQQRTGQVIETNAATFKGLERPVVVLGLDAGPESPGGLERIRRMIYTGATRAMTVLVVVGDPDTARRLGLDDLAERLDSGDGE